MIKSFLIHLSMNMWEDWAPEKYFHLDPEYYRPFYPHHCDRMPLYNTQRLWSDVLKTEDPVWKRVTEHFAACGGNMLVIDVGDAVKLHSHPEIAIGGAWSPRKLKDELARCRDLGLEVIPKFNFSSCHDAWMHEYSRMLSTGPYYRFCSDIIAEAAELFDHPRFFHIGMDEETYAHQNREGFSYRVVREGALWWDDLNFYFDEVRRTGARPWMWADKLWDCSDEEFAANVATDVVQSNWYYKEVFNFADETPEYLKPEKKRVDAYARLERLGYDQIAAGSNWAVKENYAGTVAYCTQTISPEHLLGFMTAPWFPTNQVSEPYLIEACDLVKEAHK